MVRFNAVIYKFLKNGEKSGWTYIDVPADIAHEIKANYKKSFRVKGFLDHVKIEGLALTPVGEGDFILALKQSLRKQLGKEKGTMLAVQLEEDTGFKYEIPADLKECLMAEEHLINNFLTQPKSHQNYFIRWISEAKTDATRLRRITQTVIAMDKKQSFSEMIRSNKGTVDK